MRVFSVNNSSIVEHGTFVPQFYYYNEVVKQDCMAHGGKYIRLGDYSVVSDGEHSAIPRNSKGGVRYLYGRNIREGVLDFDPISDDPYISREDYQIFNRCHISENDVLIAIYGTVGKSAVYKSSYVGTAGIPRHISNIRLKSDAPITPEYLTAFFRSKYGKAQIKSFMTGNIQQLFSLGSIRNYSVPILPEDIMENIATTEKAAILCEENAEHNIKRAIEIFYSGLGFDPRKMESDKYFLTKSSNLFEKNIWSVSLYNNLFQRIEDTMIAMTGIYRLNEIVDACHGDEVGSDAYIEYEDRAPHDIPFIRTSDIVNYEADLYPDYYVSPDDRTQVKQDVRPNDVIFTKDGKIGAVGMVVESDSVIFSSGLEILRVKEDALAKGITPQYLFVALAVPEVGLYGARRRAVFASTIPHLRESRLLDIAIPKMDQFFIQEITTLVVEAFSQKNIRKQLLKANENIIDDYFKKHVAE